ncbi:MAG: adenosylmethionine--8-amino-7-oxononanoate transaminase [Verrucomicrobia bacterium]|nr:adenosylmethionine--8-amino-7-oxononanoate transaminase [Verrucomicrobiota bacterium]
MHNLARLDHRYVWHPFTQMRDWLSREPVVIVSGRGAVLRDVRGREYLDGNASIWTLLHGHNHPRLNAAIRRQLGKIAHCSALGLANEPASVLAQRLVALAQTAPPAAAPRLAKVFFSDDGSTALEVAVKLSYEFARRAGPHPSPRFLSLEGAYHGDTLGAVSLGHIALFHRAYGPLLFPTDRVRAPYCYRCPFNRARPERADARTYRRCHEECVAAVEHQFARRRRQGRPITAMVVEPRIQGAAGMIPQPDGWLRKVTEIVHGHHAQLIADEVLTGFGRAGAGNGARARSKNPPLFASQHEGIAPDFLALAKGLTGGYLPMAATLTTSEVFDAFLGDYSEFKTFFHGHSFTANPLGAAAALASLDLLARPESVRARRQLERHLGECLDSLWALPQVGDLRQVGLIAGVELVRDWRTRAAFDLRDRAGFRVCEAMARRGVLTRPVGNVVVLMPPYCTTATQVRRLVDTLARAIRDVFA